MSTQCELVEDFFDGELAPAPADAFRQHAATCLRCQREMTALAQLRALEVQYRPELEARTGAQPSPFAAGAPQRIPPRWRWAGGGAVAALAATILMWVAWSRLVDQVPDHTWQPGGSIRLAEGRSAYSRARGYRPLTQGVLGASDTGALAYEALGKLERTGDRLGMAAGHLVRGSPRDAEEALAILQEVEPSADVLSERSFAHLVRNDPTQGDAEEALRLADQALARDSQHGPALWNRALALKVLGLPLLAARAFDAAAAQGEPGWSEEARERARHLRTSTEAARKEWLAATEAGKELVDTGADPSPEFLRTPVLRSYFYEAVRSRKSKEEVERLRPLAQKMDEFAGDRLLEAHVTVVARRDFTVRGPLADEYKHLVLGDRPVDAATLLQRLRSSGQPDLLVGALARLTHLEFRAEELDSALREESADPFLATVALRLKAEALEKGGHTDDARTVLEEALRTCLQAKLDLPCAEVELDLAYSFDNDPSKLDVATTHARGGLDAARRAYAWRQQGALVLELAQLARHREDFSVSRAFYEESLERDGGTDPDRERYAHEGLASLDVQALDIDGARAHIDAALRTGRRLGLPGVVALSDIARLRPEPERDAAAMEAFRKRLPDFHGGEHALAEEALGRWELERGRRQEGETLLRSAIRHATQGRLATIDPAARRALAYSYTSLIFDAGKRGDAEGALQFFQEESLVGEQAALPAQCLLAVTYDAPERVLAVVRGAVGGPARAFSSRRDTPLPRNLAGFLPDEALGQLSGCRKVEVLARAPVYGRPGLLPNTLAWSYRGVVPQGTAAPSSRRHLVVQEVTFSSARRTLKTPPRWSVPEVPREPVEELGRQEATPQVVLRRMEDATDITLITHALVQLESEEAYLVLAPDSAGADVLRASDIQQVRLRGHPLVVLASCQGAQPSPVLHEARNLPAAFLRAGARAVLAASDEVPARDGPEFFAAVRASIQQGTAPAEALRAMRADWKGKGRGAPWLDGVLLFE